MMNLKKYKIADESFEEEEELNSSIKINKNNIKPKQNIDNKEIYSTNTNNYYPSYNNAYLDESLNSNINGVLPATTTKGLNRNLIENNSNIELAEDLGLFNSQLQVNNYKNELPNDQFSENYHHPQVIDEDVENFKRRLDITLKNFRTDTMKEFMGIKRHLLVEQKSLIDSEKQKCDALLSSKVDQIEHLKESLAKTKNALTKETEIKEKIGHYLYKMKNSKYIIRLKTLAFTNVLKKYYKNKKTNQIISNKIKGNLLKKFKLKALKGIKRNFEEMKTLKIIASKEKVFNDKLNEMSQYYGKEINDLRNKLNEANQSVEKYKESKNQIQENLKKALMRGVVAMNLEAMNVLDEDPHNANLNIFEGVNLNSNSSSVNYNNSNINNLTSNQNQNQNLNSNIIANKEERKVVVKDNNWVNACAVPSKMKSNIISNYKEEFEEENECQAYQPYQPYQEPVNRKEEYGSGAGKVSDYYSELTKSK